MKKTRVKKSHAAVPLRIQNKRRIRRDNERWKDGKRNMV